MVYLQSMGHEQFALPLSEQPIRDRFWVSHREIEIGVAIVTSMMKCLMCCMSLRCLNSDGDDICGHDDDGNVIENEIRIGGVDDDGDDESGIGNGSDLTQHLEWFDYVDGHVVFFQQQSNEQNEMLAKPS